MDLTNRCTRIESSFKSIVFALFIPVLLAGCGGGVEGAQEAPAASPPPPATSDTIFPVLNITAPTTTTSASVTLTGTATDNVGLSQISWSNSLGGSGSAAISGASASHSFNLTLAIGSNVLTVTVSDTSGNTTPKTLTISYTPVVPPADTTSPVVTITAPTTGSTYTSTSASVTVSTTATDNVGLSQISWSNSLGGSGSAAISGASASRSFTISLQSGANAITLTARDTSGNTAQRVLTVTYSPVATNTATLAWDPPSPSTNLSGYRLYYGTAPGNYQQPSGQGISVGNVTTYTVMGLSYGTRYYFAVTAHDSSGNESTYSNEAFKDIPQN